jgi:uncharacterized repeat protein (TIGR03806 family)
MNVPIYRVVRIVVACGALAVLTVGCRQQVADSTTSNSDNVARRSAVGNAFQQDSDSAASVSGKVAQLPADGSDSSVTPVSHNRRAQYPRLLSEYALFDGAISALQPTEGVVQYDVNTPSFADYAVRQRVVRLPPGTSAKYTDFAALDFPVGTIIAKTFYYLHDMTQPDAGRHLIETRILWRQESGWIGIPYLWNEDQSDARLALAGGAVAVQWVHKNGEPRSNTHIVPNLNDCKRCHQNETMEPLGPKARYINRDFEYAHGTENQLSFWTRTGLLTGAPEPDQAPRVAVWDDPTTGSLDDRARAWLEINCAHCHNPQGPARNSGLHLNIDVHQPYQLGVFKTPVAAGQGTGGRLYDIVPGKPDESILLFRLQTTHPGAVMPEFGRSLVQDEAVDLIRQWIAEMPSATSAQAAGPT